ncbi:MAG TPA: hypothetical protein VMP01_27630 [Pirellulaceae bacterium]|nr:hypothetical protein [Pirellulaceae bacterium]
MASRILPFLRSLLRFRLRKMLLVVLAIGVGMGIHVNRVNRQQARSDFRPLIPSFQS